MAPHGQVRLQQDAEVTHKGRGPYQGPQTLSSPVSRWMHRLRVVHHKKSVFSGLSRSLLERIHSTQHQAPYDAAAVELLMEGPTCKAESHWRKSEMIGRDSQQSHPGRRCRAGTAAARARSPEGRHSRESGRLKGPRRRGLSVGGRRDRTEANQARSSGSRTSSTRTSWSTVSKAAERSSRPPASIASVISVTSF